MSSDNIYKRGSSSTLIRNSCFIQIWTEPKNRILKINKLKIFYNEISLPNQSFTQNSFHQNHPNFYHYFHWPRLIFSLPSTHPKTSLIQPPLLKFNYLTHSTPHYFHQTTHPSSIHLFHQLKPPPLNHSTHSTIPSNHPPIQLNHNHSIQLNHNHSTTKPQLSLHINHNHPTQPLPNHNLNTTTDPTLSTFIYI